MKVGDKVLFLGRELTIRDVGEIIVEVEDADARAARDKAQAEIIELREAQIDMSGDEHSEIDATIKKLDASAREALFILKLRKDLLDYWEDRGVWVSDGRILSDDQNAKYMELTGKKCLPDKQRNALVMLEKMEG